MTVNDGTVDDPSPAVSAITVEDPGGDVPEIISISTSLADGSYSVDNLITNGTFDTDTIWTKEVGWTISGGKAVCDGSQSAVTRIGQEAGLITGRDYSITYTI